MSDTLTTDGLLMGGLLLDTVLLVLLALFVFLRFRRTTHLLQTFQQERYLGLSVNQAATTRQPAADVTSASKRTAAALNRALLKSELREHVVTLSRKGFAAPDIARVCSIPESDVNVLLGFARLHRQSP